MVFIEFYRHNSASSFEGAVVVLYQLRTIAVNGFAATFANSPMDKSPFTARRLSRDRNLIIIMKKRYDRSSTPV